MTCGELMRLGNYAHTLTSATRPPSKFRLRLAFTSAVTLRDPADAAMIGSGGGLGADTRIYDHSTAAYL